MTDLCPSLAILRQSWCSAGDLQDKMQLTEIFRNNLAHSFFLQTSMCFLVVWRVPGFDFIFSNEQFWLNPKLPGLKGKIQGSLD